MAKGRPKIPAKLERQVLVETGHRCAILTCRHIDTEVHHIVPWSKCQKHEYKNLIVLCPNCHKRADSGEIDKKSLRQYKANLRYLYDKYFPWEIDILFNLYNKTEGSPELWPSAMTTLITRIVESGFVRVDKDE